MSTEAISACLQELAQITAERDRLTAENQTLRRDLGYADKSLNQWARIAGANAGDVELLRVKLKKLSAELRTRADDLYRYKSLSVDPLRVGTNKIVSTELHGVAEKLEALGGKVEG